MPVNETTLTQYALGILDYEEYRAIQTKISASPTLQKELVMIRHALQPLALAEKPIHPSNHLRNKILSSIRDQTQFDGFIERFADFFDLNRPTSQNLLAKINLESDSLWKSTLFPGVTIMKFSGGSRVAMATCGIVQVKPGKLFPAHQHQGNEEILVLQGEARDDKGYIFAPGDRFHFSAGSRHSFYILGDETFVFAVVLDKKNKWLWIKTCIDYLQLNKKKC